MLEKHKPLCKYHVYSGDRHCSCGKDLALKELENIIHIIENISMESVMTT